MKQTKPAEINARIDKILKDRAESLQEIGDTLTRTFEEMKAATREAETAQSAGDVELYTEIQLEIEKLSMAAKVRKNQYAALSQSPLVTGDESRAVADELIAYERENDRCYLKAVAKAVTMLANAQREYEDNLQAAKDALIERTETNLTKNILPFVEDNPGTQFYFFFPPYSILYWNNVKRENTFEATMEQYRYVAERLLGYKNARVFYFQTMEETLNLSNYADYSHYKPAINKFMVECFKDGKYEIKSVEEMDKGLLTVRKMVADFDYADLFSRKW